MAAIQRFVTDTFGNDIYERLKKTAKLYTVFELMINRLGGACPHFHIVGLLLIFVITTFLKSRELAAFLSLHWAELSVEQQILFQQEINTLNAWAIAGEEPDQEDELVDKYRMVSIMDDNGKPRLLVFLPHPEFMTNPHYCRGKKMKWIHQETVTRVIELLFEVEATIHDLWPNDERARSFRVDFSALEATLKTKRAIKKKLEDGKLVHPKTRPKKATPELNAEIEPYLNTRLPKGMKDSLAKKHGMNVHAIFLLFLYQRQLADIKGTINSYVDAKPWYAELKDMVEKSQG